MQTRQEKLRRLLDDENRQFRQECEELAKRPHSQQRQEIPTLEALRQRLLEKKAEQSLYLPSSRRRHQAYFYNSDSLIENPRKVRQLNFNLKFVNIKEDMVYYATCGRSWRFHVNVI